MKNAIRAAVGVGAMVLATPTQADALLMEMGSYMCEMSATDRTGAFDCRQELRPSNQKTPLGVTKATRLRVEQCDGVQAQPLIQIDPNNPNRAVMYVGGYGAAACLPQVIDEVNRELKANAIRCSVASSVVPSSQNPGWLVVSGTCDGKDK